MATREQLLAYLDEIEQGSERLYDRDFLGRLWLADYAGRVDLVADELRRRVEAEKETSDAR